MSPTSLLVVVAGAAAIITGLAMMRGPRATLRHLEETEANLRRYDAWRGGRSRLDDDGPTGADAMKEQMRRRVLLWGGLVAAGIAIVVIGLLIG